MKEIVRANIKNPEDEVSLENLDFDSSLYLRRMKSKGHKFEFGRRYKGDAGIEMIEIIVELPDPPKVLSPGSQEEWEEKRQWYLEHSGNSVKTLIRGICEGYIIETPQRYSRKLIDEVCGDLINAAQDMEMGEGEDKSDLYEWLLEVYEREKGQRKSGRRKVSPNPRIFLQERRKLTYAVIENAKRLRIKMIEGKPWTNSEFERIGFKLPEFSTCAEEDNYIFNTLETFIRAVDSKPRLAPKLLLRKLVEDSGLDNSLVELAREFPWQVYEELKQNYCSLTDSSREYDRRIEEVVLALRL